MDLRRDLFPPFLALAVSAALHGGLAWWNPRTADDAEQPEPLPVVVEYLPAAGEGGAFAEPAPLQVPERTPPRPPQPRKPPEPPAIAPAPEPVAEAPPEPEPAPAVSESSASPEPPAAAAQEPPAPLNPPPAPVAAAPKPIPLAELLPRTADIRPYAAQATVPDPTGGKAQEATLQLWEKDIRYAGYQGQVEVAVDRAWRWKEALMAAGGPGKVLVRFSVRTDGTVEGVEVVESSGSSILDREALEAVRRAALPPFPSEWTLERLNLFAQFVYRLE